MIVNYRGLELFGKLLFERATIRAPFSIPSRMPDAACFSYVMEGAYDAIGTTGIHEMKKDEAVLMKCGNHIYRTKGQPKSGFHESLAIHFDQEALQRIYDKEIPAFIQNKPDADIPEVIHIRASHLIDRYVQDLLFYFENPNLVNEDILILKMKEIILLLLQTKYANEVHRILSDVFSPQQADFRSIVEAHIFSNLSNQEFASLTNRSLTSFKREFKKNFGDSPSNYIMKRRIAVAKERLLVSTNSISQIAYDCGFKDLSHFSKLFKQHTDQSPTSFRNKHLE